MDVDCIIIGSGAAGLMAADHLVQAGKRVILLEARTRIGGRIYTLTSDNFSQPVEVGAEFIHGDAPLSSALFKAAHVSCTEMSGEVYELENGEIKKSDFFQHDWELLIHELKKLKRDTTLSNFLQQKFPADRHPELHKTIKKFVEGYNAADITQVSACALREEWSEEEEPTQQRPVGGYSLMLNFLLDRIRKGGGHLYLSEEVVDIQWSKGAVVLKTRSGNSFQGKKVLITIPLGVLTARTLNVQPGLDEYLRAAEKIGFGGVIKFLIEFSHSFWKDTFSRKFPEVKFIFSDTRIPTWWSQRPATWSLLTGWLGGPATEKISLTNEGLLDEALASLSYLLNCPEKIIRTGIHAWQIKNWLSDPYSRGAYSYTKVESPPALKLLNTPIEDTIFFAGEGLYEGPYTGTVEAALKSGKDAAIKIIKSAY